MWEKERKKEAENKRKSFASRKKLESVMTTHPPLVETK